MMNIFIAGGSGFIGTNLVKQLEILGHNVYNFDIRDDSLISNACNLDRTLASIRTLSNAEIVYHLANIPAHRLSIENPHGIIQNNYNATLNIAEACRKSDCKKIVFLSSFAVYGNHLPPWDEETPVKATTPYGLGKIQSEMLLFAYHKWYGLDVIIIRPSNVFGENEELHLPLQVIPQWFEDAKKNIPLIVHGSKTTRDFTYVQDIVQGTILASSKSGYEIYNLCSGRPTLLWDIAHMISDNVVIKDLPSHETEQWWGSYEKAKRDFGYTPTKTIEEWINEQKAMS